MTEEDKVYIDLRIREIAQRIESEGMKNHEEKVTRHGFMLGIVWFAITLFSVYTMVGQLL